MRIWLRPGKVSKRRPFISGRRGGGSLRRVTPVKRFRLQRGVWRTDPSCPSRRHHCCEWVRRRQPWRWPSRHIGRTPQPLATPAGASGCVIANILFSNPVANIRRIWVIPAQLRMETLGKYTIKYRTMFVAVALSPCRPVALSRCRAVCSGMPGMTPDNSAMSKETGQ